MSKQVRGREGGRREEGAREVPGRAQGGRSQGGHKEEGPREGEHKQQRGREHTGEGRECTQEREGESTCAGAEVRESTGLRKGECRQQGESTWGEQAQRRAQA